MLDCVSCVPTDRESGFEFGHEALALADNWLLQPVPLGQADDEALFEVALRLKHSQEPGVALPALQQLTHSWMADLPAEAIVQRHGVLVRDRKLQEGKYNIGLRRNWRNLNFF